MAGGRETRSFHATPSNHTVITYRLSIHIFCIFSLHEYSYPNLPSAHAIHVSWKIYHRLYVFVQVIGRERNKRKKERVAKLICGLENSQNCKYQFFSFFPPPFKSRIREMSEYRRSVNSITSDGFSFLFPLLFGLIFHIPHPVNQLSVRLSFHLAKPVFCIPLTAACDWISDFINS